jgi:hypothetical protein
MPGDVLEREIDKMRLWIDANRVRVRNVELPFRDKLPALLTKDGDSSGLRRNIEEAQAGVEGEDVGILADRMRFHDLLRAEVEDGESVIRLSSDESEAMH